MKKDGFKNKGLFSQLKSGYENIKKDYWDYQNTRLEAKKKKLVFLEKKASYLEKEALIRKRIEKSKADKLASISNKFDNFNKVLAGEKKPKKNDFQKYLQ